MRRVAFFLSGLALGGWLKTASAQSIFALTVDEIMALKRVALVLRSMPPEEQLDFLNTAVAEYRVGKMSNDLVDPFAGGGAR